MMMASQQSLPSHARPPPLFPPTDRPRSIDLVKGDVMEIEFATGRSQRAASVLSGLSADDIEAAETLKSLQQDIHSPRLPKTPPTHVQTTSTFNSNESEPLLSLITSRYPLAASVINGSISVYQTAKHFTPGGQWTEENVGLPLARAAARTSGVESGLRWALQAKKQSENGQLGTPDVEKAYFEVALDGSLRQAEHGLAEPLPAYSAGDRSPPYSEQVVLSREQQRDLGWRQQLVITTSGLGVAMSEESIRSLKFCLGWLRWANDRLGGAVQNLKDLIHQYDRRSSQDSRRMSVSSLTTSEEDDRALAARVAAVKTDILNTLKQVVSVVSTYAGGALPDNARDLVRQQLVTLPQRFTIASRRASDEESHDAATNNANRALVLAQEGLDMMNQVSRVVNDTLVSAENWCEKLGRRRRQPEQQQQQRQQRAEQPEEQARSETVRRDTDVKMEM